MDYKEADVTSCDNSTLYGKAGKYVIKYIEDKNVDKEIELRRESRNFNINKYTNTHTEHRECNCKSKTTTGWEWNSSVNWLTTWITYDRTSYIWYVRADGSRHQVFNDPTGKNEKFIEIRREERVNANSIGASEQWRKFYEFHSNQSPADYLAQEKEKITKDEKYILWKNQKTNSSTCISGKLPSVSCTGLYVRKGEDGYCSAWIPYIP